MRVPWPVLILALTLPAAGAFVYFFVADPESPAFRISYSTAKVIQFALPLAALLAFDRSRLFGIRVSTRGLGTGIAIGLLMGVAILGLYGLALRGSPLFTNVADAIRPKLLGLGVYSAAAFAAFAAFLSVVHSLLEEYYWRWFVHAALRERLPAVAATAVSSLAFAAHHVIVLHMYFPDRFWTATLPFSVGVAIGGACWAWLFDRRNSLAGSWACHALADAALMAIGFDLMYR